MRFDRTFIAIRERSTLGILDLALHVVVEHIRPLSILLLINAAPWILINHLLLGQLIYVEYDTAFSYYWAMTWLVICQAQLGTFLITQYLGKAMFEGRPKVGELLKGCLKVPFYYLFSQLALRLTGGVLLAALLLQEPGDSELLAIGCTFVFLGSAVGAVIRAVRPFVTEILLLERTPIRAKPNSIHFSARSRSLHAFASNELVGKAFVTGVMGAALVFAIHCTFVSVDQVMNIRANSESSFQPYYFVASLWIVSGFISVVRFLYYIDLRIRQEGWAVELRMRAEAQRLEQE